MKDREMYLVRPCLLSNAEAAVPDSTFFMEKELFDLLLNKSNELGLMLSSGDEEDEDYNEVEDLIDSLNDICIDYNDSIMDADGFDYTMDNLTDYFDCGGKRKSTFIAEVSPISKRDGITGDINIFNCLKIKESDINEILLFAMEAANDQSDVYIKFLEDIINIAEWDIKLKFDKYVLSIYK